LSSCFFKAQVSIERKSKYLLKLTLLCDLYHRRAKKELVSLCKHLVMSYSHSYTINLSWQHDRQGILTSTELDQQLKVATPPPFPKGIERVWSPEHLFTAAISSCLMTTFLAIAENFKLDFENFTCPATGKLDQVEGKYKMTEVVLEPVVTVFDEKDESKALRVLEKAEAACLITNSVTARVIMKPKVIIASPEVIS